MQKLPNVDILAPVNKLAFAKNETIDAVLASHVLEHFSYFDVDSVLAEWNRVLKIGGTLYVAVPDMMNVIDFINKYGWGVWMERVIFGDQDYEYAHHKAGFTEESLKTKLEYLGFDNLQRVDKFPLDIKGKTASRMMFPDMLNQEEAKCLSLNIVARKRANIIGEVASGYYEGQQRGQSAESKN
jgi:predicted SAM-dependent methyltransferase